MAKAPDSIKKAMKKSKPKVYADTAAASGTYKKMTRVDRGKKPVKASGVTRAASNTYRDMEAQDSYPTLKKLSKQLPKAQKTATTMAKAYKAKDYAKLDNLTTKAARQERQIKERIRELKSLPVVPNRKEVMKDVRGVRDNLKTAQKLEQSVVQKRQRRDRLGDNDTRKYSEPVKTAEVRLPEEIQRDKYKLNSDDLEALKTFVPKNAKEARHIRERISATLQDRDHGGIPTEVLEQYGADYDAAIADLEHYERLKKAGKDMKKDKWGDRQILPEDVWDPNERRYKNLVGAAQHFDRMIAGEEGFYPGENTNSMMTVDEKYVNELPDEEKNVYNYLFYTKGEEEANKFLEDSKKVNRKRYSERLAKQLDENDSVITDTAAAITQGGTQFLTGLVGVKDALTGDYTDLSDIEETESAAINKRRQKLSGVGGVMFDLVNTISNQVPSMVIGGLAGGTAGSAVLGASAGGNTYREMKKQGYSKEQARGVGLVTGALEATLQRAMGGMAGMTGTKVTALGDKLTRNMSSLFGKKLTTGLLEMGGEALEEGSQEFLAPFVKSLFTGSDIKVDWDEVGYSALLGALSSGVTNSVTMGLSGDTDVSVEDTLKEYSLDNHKGRKLGRQIKADTDYVDNLQTLREAVETEENNGKEGMAQRVENATDVALADSDIDNADTAATIKSAIVKDATGQALTEAEQNALISPAGQAVQLAVTDNVKQNIKQDAVVTHVANEILADNTPAVRQAVTKMLTGQELSRADEQLINASNLQEDMAKIAGVYAQQIGATAENARSALHLDSIAQPNTDSTPLLIADSQGNGVEVRSVEGDVVHTDQGDIPLADAQLESPQAEELLERGSALPAAEQEGFFKYATPTVNAETNMEWYLQIKDLARDGIPINAVLAEYTELGMSTDGIANAYEAGVRESRSQQASNDYATQDESVTIADNVDQTDAETQSKISVLTAMSKMFGYNVEIISDPNREAGGYSNNTLTINVASDEAMSTAFSQTVSHEMVHWGKDNAPAEYEEYRRQLFAFLESKGIDVEAEVQNRMDTFNYDRETALDEMAAEGGETLLRDSEAISRMSNDPDTGSFIKKIFNRVKKFFNNLFSGTAEKTSDVTSAISDSTKEELINVINAYDEMIIGAADTARSGLAEARSPKNSNLLKKYNDILDRERSNMLDEGARQLSATESASKDEAQETEEEYEPAAEDLEEEEDVKLSSDAYYSNGTDYSDMYYTEDNDKYYRMTKKQREIFEALKNTKAKDEFEKLVKQKAIKTGEPVTPQAARKIARLLAQSVYGRQNKDIGAMGQKAETAFNNFYELLQDKGSKATWNDALNVFHDLASDITRDSAFSDDLAECVNSLVEMYAGAEVATTIAQRKAERYKAKMEDRIKNAKLKRKTAELRKKLIRKVDRLSKRTTAQRAGVKQIAPEMKQALAEMLSTLNTESTSSRATKLNADIATLREKLRAIAKDKDYIQLTDMWQLDHENEQNRTQWSIWNEIDKLGKILEGQQLRNLGSKNRTLAQDFALLEQANKIATTIERGLQKINSLNSYENYVSRAEQAAEVVKDLRKAGHIEKKASRLRRLSDAYGDMRTPVTYQLERAVGYNEDSPLYKAKEELVHADREMNMKRMEWMKQFAPEQEGMTPKQIKAARKAFESAVEDLQATPFTDKNGKPIKLTKMEMFELVLTYEREINHPFMSHLTESGAVFLDRELLAKGKIKEAEVHGTRISPEQITQKNIADIEATFTPWDQEYLGKIKDFMRNTVHEEVNDYYFKTRGYKITPEEFYYPERTPASERSQTIGNVDVDEITPGWEHELNKDANQSALLGSALSTVNRMINQVSERTTLHVAMDNLESLLNTRPVNGNGFDRMNLRAEMIKAIGQKTMDGIDKKLSDVRGKATDTSPESEIFQKLIGFYANSKIVANPGTLITVGMSMLQIKAYVGPKAFASMWGQWTKRIVKNKGKVGFRDGTDGWLQQLRDEIDEHSATNWMRREGDIGDYQAELARQFKKSKEAGKGIGQNKVVKGVTDAGKAVLSAPGKALTFMDATATLPPWLACKAEVKAQGVKEGTETYWKKVADMYDTFMEQTQSSDSVLHKPGMMNGGTVLKMLTLFKNEVSKTGALIENRRAKYFAKRAAYNDDPTEANKKAMKQARKEFTRSVVATTNTMACMSLVAIVRAITAGKKFEDEEGSILPWLLDESADAMIQDAVSYASPIIGNAFWSVKEYDQITTPVITDAVNIFRMITNTYQAGKLGFNEEEMKKAGLKSGDFKKYLRYGIQSMFEAVGVPAGSINKMTNGVLNAVGAVRDNRPLSKGRTKTYGDSETEYQTSPLQDLVDAIADQLLK